MSIYDRDTPVKVSFTLPRNMLEDLSTKTRKRSPPILNAARLGGFFIFVLFLDFKRKSNAENRLARKQNAARSL